MGIKVYDINRAALMNVAYITTGITFIIPGLLPPSGFVWFAVITGIGGILGPFYHASFNAILQSNIDPAALGRVFSMHSTVTALPALIGLVAIGFFSDSLGVTTSFVVCGAVIVALGIWAFLVPSVMRIDNRSRRRELGIGKPKAEA
jgi:DHA3 family macrolide efflux protein-like MFS transporter